MYHFFYMKDVDGTNAQNTVEHSDQEVHIDPSHCTDKFFEDPSSPIAMDFANNEPIHVVVVQAEKPIHVAEQHNKEVMFLVH